MNAIFLHGGGDREAGRVATFGRFVTAATDGCAGVLALIVADVDEAAALESYQVYRAIFLALGLPAERLAPLPVSPANPLTYDMVAYLAPAGVFVGGGLTPLYHQALCVDRAWLAYLQETGAPYGGTSAGAAIAGRQAILGGWQAVRDGRSREIIFAGAGEGLERLTVHPGLDLVPFAVDVHAGQMGTLIRMIQAVDLGLAPEGWAIDENTMLAVHGPDVNFLGLGHAYHVRRAAGATVQVTVHAAAGTAWPGG